MSTGGELNLLQLSKKEKFNGRVWMVFQFWIENFMQLAECWDIVFHTNGAGVRGYGPTSHRGRSASVG